MNLHSPAELYSPEIPSPGDPLIEASLWKYRFQALAQVTRELQERGQLDVALQQFPDLEPWLQRLEQYRHVGIWSVIDLLHGSEGSPDESPEAPSDSLLEESALQQLDSIKEASPEAYRLLVEQAAQALHLLRGDRDALALLISGADIQTLQFLEAGLLPELEQLLSRLSALYTDQ